MKKQKMGACSAETATDSLPKKPDGDVKPVCKGKGKKLHETIYKAIAHVLRISERGKKEFGSYYWCEACQGYHVTSKPPNGKFRKL